MLFQHSLSVDQRNRHFFRGHFILSVIQPDMMKKLTADYQINIGKPDKNAPRPL